MPIADHRPVKALTHTSAQTVLRLTRDEVRVLQYYRTLSNSDREATRCLLQVLQAEPPTLACRPIKAKPATRGSAKRTTPIRL